MSESEGNSSWAYKDSPPPQFFSKFVNLIDPPDEELSGGQSLNNLSNAQPPIVHNVQQRLSNYQATQVTTHEMPFQVAILPFQKQRQKKRREKKAIVDVIKPIWVILLKILCKCDNEQGIKFKKYQVKAMLECQRGSQQGIVRFMIFWRTNKIYMNNQQITLKGLIGQFQTLFTDKIEQTNIEMPQKGLELQRLYMLFKGMLDLSEYRNEDQEQELSAEEQRLIKTFYIIDVQWMIPGFKANIRQFRNFHLNN